MSTKNNKQIADNIFEKNPRKTLIILAVVVIAAVLFCLEFILSQTDRTERPGTVRYIRLRENPPGAMYQIVPNELYMKTALEYDPSKHRLKIDEHGFIHPSKIHDHPDLTVVFLGGSTTECLCVEEEKRFPYLAGRLLEKRGLKVNSWNGGVAGNDSLHSIDSLINKVFRLKPDIVIMMHNINDLSVLMGQKTYWHDIPTRSVIVSETPVWAFESALRQLKNMLFPNLYIRIRNISNSARSAIMEEKREFERLPALLTEKEVQMITADFSSNLKSFIDLCKARNIKPVLMTMASRLTEKPTDVVKGGAGNLPPMSDAEYHHIRSLFNAFNDTIRYVGKENNVPVIDLAAAIPQDTLHLYDVIHLTDHGSETAAGIIADKIAFGILKLSSVPEKRAKLR